MLLAAVTDIIEQLGFDAMTDITDAVTAALNAAEPMLAARLNMDFEQTTGNVDTFFVERPPRMVRGAVETSFRMRKGLITSVTSVQATWANSNSFLFPVVGVGQDSTPPANQQATPQDVSGSMLWENEKGVARDITNRYRVMFVQFTYNAGIAVDPASNGTSYLLTGTGSVPTWLQEAAKRQALINLADSPVLSEAQIKLDTKTLGLELIALISRRLRYAPQALLPL